MTPTTAQTEDALTHALRTIRGLWPAMLTQSLSPSRSSDTASTDEVMSLDRLISLRHEITALLAEWARLVIDHRGTQHHTPTTTDTNGLCLFLERHAQWLSGHPAAPDAITELRQAANQVRTLAVPKRRDWLPIGDCPVTIANPQGNPTPCAGKVRAYPNRQFIRCPHCGTEDTLAWWMSQIIPEGSDLGNADTVIAFVVSRTFRPISHEQLRQWATRGQVLRHGRDVKGRTLYSSHATLDWVVNQTREAAA
jgi:hypothetical protein